MHSCILVCKVYYESFSLPSLHYRNLKPSSSLFLFMYLSGILDDMYALCEACKVPLSSLLLLMDVYRKELDYVVVSRLVDVSMHE